MKRRAKAGILIYALAISAIFLLLLQFYLTEMTMIKREILLKEEKVTAELMVEMTKKSAEKLVKFDKGSCQIVGNAYQVELNNGHKFIFDK